MRSNRFNRRDFLKFFGSISSSIIFSKILNVRTSFADNASKVDAPNFILLIFDTLSAQHMSLYGHKRQTTPHIDKFAQKSTVYHRNYSAASYTQSSTASLLTGVYPWSHRSLDFLSPLLNRFEKDNIFSGMFPSHQSITYTHNYHVANILDQLKENIALLKPIEELALYNRNIFENLFKNDKLMGSFTSKKLIEEFFGPSYSLFMSQVYSMKESSAYEKINEMHKESYPLGVGQRDGYLFRLEDAIDWIEQITNNTPVPYFGYFHLLPPHEAYRPRADFLDIFANDNFRLPQKPDHFFSDDVSEEALNSQCQRYDEYISLVDAEFGRLVQAMEEKGLLENTYLILTSDHGQLFERGIHGHLSPALYDSVIHTPLIIHAPKQTQGYNVYSPTSALDLVPTLLHLAQQKQLDGLEGKVLPVLGGKEDYDRIIFSMYTRENPKLAPLDKVTLSVIQWPYKLIQYRGYEGYDNIDELYNLEKDPDELVNIADIEKSIVTFLKNELSKSQAVAEKKSINTQR